MSNIALFNPAQVPAFARTAAPSELALALAGGGDFGKRISIRGGVFRLIDSGKEVAKIDERFLDVVLVKAAPKVARVFYMSEWDAENPSPPDCWSANGEIPSSESNNKQSSSCATCPQNIAGSGKGNSRACRFQQRIALTLADAIDGDVFELTVPALSLFGKATGDDRPLQEYVRWLSAQNIDPGAVVTRLKFDTNSESPKLFFKAVRWLTEDEFADAKDAADSVEAEKAITMSIAKSAPAVAAPAELAGTRPAAATKAKEPVPTPEPEPAPPAPKTRRTRASAAPAAPAPTPEPEVDEPVVRAAPAKAPTVGNAAGLASVIDGWDDE